ncbi:CNP1-like family protein [Oxalobacter aliiformigenes]|uniref:CNP1-like family protein n=1 Tax=Oxalobacter aliiformigenes TaxID=2946593 RepID=A0A9E9LFG7_9BURK|nr:CNP1-like family protein [Oxalobacter aliiformigenes]WAV91714.1 CNP1-like family protein [Oxalobacter aliiformigenes]
MSVGKDEIRYTMVTKSQAGATNVSYEGIRCGTFEFRRYAYGHRDNKWVMSKNETWRPINFYAANRPRAVLTQEYFCDGKGIAGSNEDMIFRIRYNRSLVKNKYTGSSF